MPLPQNWGITRQEPPKSTVQRGRQTNIDTQQPQESCAPRHLPVLCAPLRETLGCAHATRRKAKTAKEGCTYQPPPRVERTPCHCFEPRALTSYAWGEGVRGNLSLLR